MQTNENYLQQTLSVSEVYRSLQGEASLAGLPCVLIRLTGCNMDCSWCDTLHAREETGTLMTIAQILDKVNSLDTPRVELTGGEPLLQPAAVSLLSALCEAGYQTLVETNGSVDISTLDSRVIRIVDVKCPASGMSEMNRFENLDLLRSRDEVKFVIAGAEDFAYAIDIVRKHRLTKKCSVIFSPVWGKITAANLAEWILESREDIRLGMQLHKIIWPDIDRGV